MASSKAALSGIDPLKDLLSDVLARLETLEAKAGVSAAYPSAAKSPIPVKATLHVQVAAGEATVVKDYDAYVKSAVVPLAQACDDLGGLQTMGKSLTEAWESIRTIIVLASRAKAPTEELGVALAPHLAATQAAVKQIRDLKLDRDWDRHYKAVVEMLSCLSWILYKAPKGLPSTVVKDAIGSAEFWSNRIRKDFKGKDEKQIAFCDNIKKVLTGLVEYVESYHKTGLAFNPRGMSLTEASIRLSDDPIEETDVMKSPKHRHPTLGNAPGGNTAGLMGELDKRKSADGSSAATGLKHVTRDQQTWRKEFKNEGPSALPVAPTLAAKPDEKKKKKPLLGLPVFEYQDRGFKWVIENHTKESVTREVSKDGIVTVEISDPKQQVYLYNCEGVTVKVVGKFKSLILDKCVKCSVIYDNLISVAETVNCKKIQLQVTGVCPAFTIDKTIGCLIWLSEESKAVSTFTTSLSSELNVSFPDGDDQKEIPVPEQFVHRITNGSLSSEVSDLYH